MTASTSQGLSSIKELSGDVMVYIADNFFNPLLVTIEVSSYLGISSQCVSLISQKNIFNVRNRAQKHDYDDR